jgi:hypothetical protein
MPRVFFLSEAERRSLTLLESDYDDRHVLLQYLEANYNQAFPTDFSTWTLLNLSSNLAAVCILADFLANREKLKWPK